MTNTSATGGFLLPNPAPAPQPLEDAALVAFFQGLVVGLTGLDGTLVRPRWQPVMPTPPDNATTWVAVGIHSREADAFAYTYHDPNASSGAGADVVQRTETLDVLCSVYGPGADGVAALIRDGLSVSQNLEAAEAAGLSVIDVGPARAMSTVINTLWYYRLDMMLHFRRLLTRQYPVLNILSADITLVADTGISTLVSILDIDQ